MAAIRAVGQAAPSDTRACHRSSRVFTRLSSSPLAAPCAAPGPSGRRSRRARRSRTGRLVASLERSWRVRGGHEACLRGLEDRLQAYGGLQTIASTSAAHLPGSQRPRPLTLTATVASVPRTRRAPRPTRRDGRRTGADRPGAPGGGRRGHPRPVAVARGVPAVAGRPGLPEPVHPGHRRRQQRRRRHRPGGGRRSRRLRPPPRRQSRLRSGRQRGARRWSRARRSSSSATTTWRWRPTAVRAMVEEAFRSNAGIVTPKVVEWDDPTRLLSVGESADKTGVRAPIVERGELDQEQHDAVRDVFCAPGGCTLVRADLFAVLGGFDPAMELLGEDLDLSWRAQVAGARVVAVPAAVVRHVQASDRPATHPGPSAPAQPAPDPHDAHLLRDVPSRAGPAAGARARRRRRRATRS